jgi:hypothetical protein
LNCLSPFFDLRLSIAPFLSSTFLPVICIYILKINLVRFRSCYIITRSIFYTECEKNMRFGLKFECNGYFCSHRNNFNFRC